MPPDQPVVQQLVVSPVVPKPPLPPAHFVNRMNLKKESVIPGKKVGKKVDFKKSEKSSKS